MVDVPPNSLSTKAGSVLIVDDNPLILNVVRSLLTSNNYEVLVCENGHEALEVLSSKSVDLILCDVMMPRMDGYTFHDIIRRESRLSHIPFVFLTGLDERSEIDKGRETGADHYMTKPFDPRELLGIVRGKVIRAAQIKQGSQERYDSYRRKIIHTLSHEFRTPLVAINTGAELLLDESPDKDRVKTRLLLEAVRRGGERLEKLVNDFMCLQQIEAGVAAKVQAERSTKIHVSRFVDEMIEHWGADTREQGDRVQFKNNCRDEVINICDAQVTDCLDRIIDNAIKFSDAKDVVDVVVFRQEDVVVFEVRDRGSGIDLNRISEAIDPFGQLNRDKFEQQGSGLGLAIADRYAKLNKGVLQFDRRDGGGTVVSLLLPIL